MFQDRYLDKRFNNDRPTVRGYVFGMTLIDKPEKAAVTFQLCANPEYADGIGVTGRIYFYSEPDAGIFINREGPASVADDLL